MKFDLPTYRFVRKVRNARVINRDYVYYIDVGEKIVVILSVFNAR